MVPESSSRDMKLPRTEEADTRTRGVARTPGEREREKEREIPRRRLGDGAQPNEEIVQPYEYVVVFVSGVGQGSSRGV